MEEGRTTPKLERSKHGGRWFRGKKLGAGSFGTVHFAFFPASNPHTSPYFRDFPHIAAVKSAPHSEAAQLYWEKKVYDALRDCPFIVNCLGDDVTANNKDGDMIYNVFLEYAPFGTLKDLIDSSKHSRRLPEREVRAFARSILGAIERIHGADLVHCDIKLENVLLFHNNNHEAGNNKTSSPKYLAKVADLGLAKRIDGYRKENIRCLQGTPMYWAPEVMSDGVQGKASDIWALGCLVFEMLTGKFVWDDHSGNATDGGESPSLPLGMFSDEAESFMRLCFQSDPRLRPTAGELLRHRFVVGDGERVMKTVTGNSTNNSVVSLAPAWMQKHQHHRQLINC